MFQLIFFFAFWGAENHVFHIVPFRPKRYALKRFRCLVVSNRVRNWNKVKNNIYVRSKLLLCQMEIPILINKLMCQSSFINQDHLCFVNSIVYEPKWRHKYHFTTIIISYSQIETLVSYSSSTNVNVNKLFPSSNFEGNFST